MNVIMQRRFTAQLGCRIAMVSRRILGGYCASSVCEFSCASRIRGFLSARFVTVVEEAVQEHQQQKSPYITRVPYQPLGARGCSNRCERVLYS